MAKQGKALRPHAFADDTERLESEAMNIEDYAKFVLALIFVLGLIGLLATVARRLGLGLPQTQTRRGQAKRLAIVEVSALDAKRRLVLIRRDAVEHLIILGHNGETVVETNITPPAAPAFTEVLRTSRDISETRAEPTL
ncbi:MAG TPA: flagellar biosynthetic protein FliO [Magnetovibrio sp.]